MGLTAYNTHRRLQAEKAKQEPVKQEKHTYNSIKTLDRSKQCALCKQLGLKGYTTCKEEVRIQMILDNQ